MAKLVYGLPGSSVISSITCVAWRESCTAGAW